MKTVKYSGEKLGDVFPRYKPTVHIQLNSTFKSRVSLAAFKIARQNIFLSFFLSFLELHTN